MKKDNPTQSFSNFSAPNSNVGGHGNVYNYSGGKKGEKKDKFGLIYELNGLRFFTPSTCDCHNEYKTVKSKPIDDKRPLVDVQICLNGTVVRLKGHELTNPIKDKKPDEFKKTVVKLDKKIRDLGDAVEKVSHDTHKNGEEILILEKRVDDEWNNKKKGK